MVVVIFIIEKERREMNDKPAIRQREAIEEITQASYIPIKRDIMENKNYRVDVRSVLESHCKVAKMKDGSYVKRIADKELRKVMRRAFGMRKDKINKVIAAYLNEGVLTFGDEGEYVISYLKPFVYIDAETLRYCLSTVSGLAFKVYCYLKMMSEAQARTHRPGFPRVSVSGEKGLLALCGYATSGSSNRRMMNDVLESLRDSGLIRISDPYPVRTRGGVFNGWYRDVIDVRSVVEPQADTELVPWKEEFRSESTDEYYLFPMYIEDKAYRYDEDKVGMFLDQLLLDERNFKALDTATLYGHLEGRDYQRAWKFVRERLENMKSD